MGDLGRLVQVVLVTAFICSSKVTPYTQKLIVDSHNAFRKRMAPNATNMMKMVWDEALAEEAMKHALRYSMEHDNYYDRYSDSLPGVATGQNLCYGSIGWSDCLNKWFKEGDDFEYGTGSLTGNAWDVLHAAQILYWKTNRIGCARGVCGCSAYFVCNYAYTLVWEEYSVPWKNGQPCEACPNNCVDGLCDCGGKMCMNDGSLDLGTCECTCINHPNSPFQGDECQSLNCAVSSPGYCNGYTTDLQDMYCRIYTNLRNECPHFCKRCE
ncbi:CRISP [Mytilus edulis]|uniref:CRISP n=1 Tax=Mytilus edulis TaxID=6550 RepID=A0A8S3RY03_MYTED|nr:CRISP [Mytilus edulis]